MYVCVQVYVHECHMLTHGIRAIVGVPIRRSMYLIVNMYVVCIPRFEYLSIYVYVI